MFEHLAAYRIILVSGLHRGGTTITGRMIADDLGYAYLDEWADKLYDKHEIMRLIRYEGKLAIQCPGMARWLVDLSVLAADVAVVWVWRDPQDIRASMKTKLFDGGRALTQNQLQAYPEYRDAGYDIVDAKRLYFEQHQRGKVAHLYEVQYEDLKSHKLWVDKGERASWKFDQWRLDG